MMLTIVASVVVSGVTGATMKQVRTSLGCGPPFNCVHVTSVPIPTAGHGEALIRVNGSSVNPSDVDEVELGACIRGCGADVSGTVVSCSGCSRLKVGDEVWTLASPAYSEYVVAKEENVGLKPVSIDLTSAATIPEVGLTSLFSLKRTAAAPGTPLPAGSPWTKDNLTIVITAGSGGTGSVGIELAKAWGATNIATATTGAAGIAFVKSLGATFVTDYKVVDIFDALSDDSVDIVYDNYGAEGTADKAMPKLREGGVYLLMPHGECFVTNKQGPPCLSAHPKAGVTQLNYNTGPDFNAHALQGLNELKELVEQKHIRAVVDKQFDLADIKAAFAYSAGSGQGGVGEHIGKISIRV